MYNSGTSSVKFIAKHFVLLDAVVNEIVFLILLSGCSLQVYSITIDFCVLILYSAALLILFISSNCVHLCVCVCIF